MKAWVTKILEPYWRLKMVEFNMPKQECILQLDVWKVHRGQEFMGWMKGNYPWISLEFVPGGCTGLFQPCDVGIQHPLKLSIKRHQQVDIVNETLIQFQKGVAPESVKFNLKLGCLRDRSVNWMVLAYHEINKPSIVLQVFFIPCKISYTNLCFVQAFRLCKSGDFNLSHKSITSTEALRALREIQQSDQDKWLKISLRNTNTPPVDSDGPCTTSPEDPEEESPFEDIVEDDSAVTISDLVAGITATANGSAVSDHVAVAYEGHIELVEDANEGVEKPQDITQMSIAEILQEVEASGRGK
jgi:hypothetical protein